MHSIGNDVIDLQLAKTQSNWQRKGFLEKQFTAYEQQLIFKATNSFLQVWLFWSMKEAAYKCYTQENNTRFFAPKKFSCKMISKTEGTVTIEEQKYVIKSVFTDNYIHSVASNTFYKKATTGLFLVDAITSVSKFLNSKLLTNLPENTLVEKTDLGIPFLSNNKKKLPIAISKSHHGRFGAFAISVV